MDNNLGKFKKGDYIVNRSAGDMAIIKNIDKKGYYHFEKYYDKMFRVFKEKVYTLQVNYEKFFEYMTEEEKDEFDKLIKNEHS